LYFPDLKNIKKLGEVMKKLINISFLLAILCFAAPVWADGDMQTGNKNCTQNCGGLYDGSTVNPSVSDDAKQEESTAGEIYSWIYEQISDLVG
jgi:hypothetical protein